MSPEFDVKKVLEIVGPTASLLFAAWIFLQYLNQRFTESVERLGISPRTCGNPRATTSGDRACSCRFVSMSAAAR